MKFLLDENLPAWLAADLRQLGFDAVDIREIAGPGLSDDAVYKRALREGRNIISADHKDFGNPLIYRPTKNTGILVVRMPQCSIKTVVARVLKAVSDLKPAEISGSLLILEPSRLRKKKLI